MCPHVRRSPVRCAARALDVIERVVKEPRLAARRVVGDEARRLGHVPRGEQVEISRLLEDLDDAGAARMDQRERRAVLRVVHVPRRRAHVVRVRDAAIRSGTRIGLRQQLAGASNSRHSGALLVLVKAMRSGEVLRLLAEVPLPDGLRRIPGVTESLGDGSLVGREPTDSVRVQDATGPRRAREAKTDREAAGHHGCPRWCAHVESTVPLRKSDPLTCQHVQVGRLCGGMPVDLEVASAKVVCKQNEDVGSRSGCYKRLEEDAEHSSAVASLSDEQLKRRATVVASCHGVNSYGGGTGGRTRQSRETGELIPLANEATMVQVVARGAVKNTSFWK